MGLVWNSVMFDDFASNQSINPLDKYENIWFHSLSVYKWYGQSIILNAMPLKCKRAQPL